MNELIQKNIPLDSFSSWKVGGPAEYFCQPQNLDQIKEALAWAKNNNKNITVLGSATNVLIHDDGVQGLVIQMDGIDQISDEIKDNYLHITAGAGAHKAQVLKVFLKHKLPPALFLTGLPGNIGGGVVMNAGVGEERVPREFCEIVEWMSVVKPDGELKTYLASELEWSYRTSKGWQPGVIYEVGLKWQNVADLKIMDQIRQATRLRLSKQPLDKPSCGSVFRNPLPMTSGGLIDLSGLKGHAIGGAEVSTKHANFIITHPGAKAKDVDLLIKHVQAIVLQKQQVSLHTEVVYLGNW